MRGLMLRRVVGAWRGSMPNKYVLISFYPVERRGINDEETSVWTVIGHIHVGQNVHLGEFDTHQEAMANCFRYNVPVMRGSNFAHIVEKLAQGVG